MTTNTNYEDLKGSGRSQWLVRSPHITRSIYLVIPFVKDEKLFLRSTTLAQKRVAVFRMIFMSSWSLLI